MKRPSFQFYPKDWLSEKNIAVMAPEYEGAYIRLLCYCWEDNGLPTDEQELASLSRLGEGWLKGGHEKVMKCFYLRDGKFHHKRLDEEREKQDEWKTKVSIAGKKGAKARWGAKKKENRVAMTTPSEEDSYPNAIVMPKNASSTSSSTSLSKEKINKKERFEEFVLLTGEEFSKLKEKLGERRTQEYIFRLNSYVGSKGKQYRSHYHTILAWSQKDAEKPARIDPMQFGAAI